MCDVDPEDRLGAWLAAGYHADMEWLAASREVRRDVRRKLPGARSVVVVARSYFAPRPAAARGSGRVARYAWGRDYHRVLRRPLAKLAAFIQEYVPNVECYSSIDSGPVLEKFWAARAGVGWIGKNSLVLRPGLGSWLFLGVVVTTAELAPDPPVPDQCGACTACIDNCPTRAIVEPRVLDGRRCLSYHTVENKGEIPRPLHPQLGTWVFGCDVCQEVCPWNEDVPVTDEAGFHPREGRANPDLDALTAMSEEGFRDAFAGSSIMRAKHAGMQRNARIAQGNVTGGREDRSP